MRPRLIHRYGAKEAEASVLRHGVIVLAAIAMACSAAAVVAEEQPRAVSALGRLEPEHGLIRLSLGSVPQATTWAVLGDLHVEEGDDVAKGQLLASAESAAVLQARLEEERAMLDLAQRQAEASRDSAREACSRADVARRESERRARLFADGVVGEEETDQAAGEAEARAAACTAAQTAILAADARVQLGRAGLQRAELELQRAFLHAPVASRVIEVLARPGERIGPEGVLELARVDRMYAIAEVYETDIRHVRVGQRATVDSAALPSTLEGSVSFIRQEVQKQDEIGTDPAARKDARIIEVKILLDDSAAAEALTNLQVDIVIRSDRPVQDPDSR